MNHKLYIRKIKTKKYKHNQKNQRLSKVGKMVIKKIDNIYNYYNFIHKTLTSKNGDSDIFIDCRDFEETIDSFLSIYDEKNEL